MNGFQEGNQMKSKSLLRDRSTKYLFAAPWDKDVRAFIQKSGIINKMFMTALSYFVLGLKQRDLWNIWERLYVFPADNNNASLVCLKTLEQAIYPVGTANTLSVESGLTSVADSYISTGLFDINMNIANPESFMYTVWQLNTTTNTPTVTGDSRYYMSLNYNGNPEQQAEFKCVFNNPAKYSYIRQTQTLTTDNVSLPREEGDDTEVIFSGTYLGEDFIDFPLKTGFNPSSITTTSTSFNAGREFILTAGIEDTLVVNPPKTGLNNYRIGMLGISSSISAADRLFLANLIKDCFGVYYGRKIENNY